MLIFVINWISSCVEILSPPDRIRGIIAPALFFAGMIGFCVGLNLLGWFTFGFCFCLKILFGSARLIVLLWLPGEKVTYFLMILETLFLWWILNPLLL